MKATASNARKTINFLKVHNTSIPDELIRLANTDTHSSPNLNDQENEIYQYLVDWNGRIIINNDLERHALKAINQYYLDYPPQTMNCYFDDGLICLKDTIQKHITFPYNRIKNNMVLPISNSSFLFVIKNLDSWNTSWSIIKAKWNCTILVAADNGTNSLRLDQIGFIKYSTILKNINSNLYNLFTSAISSSSYKNKEITEETMNYLKMLGIFYIS